MDVRHGGSEREYLWRRDRRRAWFRLALAALALTAWPAAMVVWALAAQAAARGWLPAWLGGALGLATAAAVAAMVLRHLARRFARAPLDGLTSAALAWRHGGGTATTAVLPQAFWRRQMRSVVRDAYWAALGLALVFAMSINTVPLWLGPAAALLGVPYHHTVQSHEPLLRLADVRVTSPLDGRTRRVAAGDGFLAVDEGAIVHWRLQPLRPATAVVMTIGERELATAVTAAGATFTARVTVPTSYRFALRRWGVEWREAWMRRIEVRPDAVPQPRWIVPPPAQPPSNRLLEFAWAVDDDRAVTELYVEARGEAQTQAIPLWQGEQASIGPVTAVLDLAELPQGEQVVLTLVARDNDAIAGPNEGRSEPMLLRLRDARRRHEDWRESLAALLRQGVDGLAQAWTPRRLHPDLARDLAARAAALADEAETVAEASFGARDALIAIARHWRAASPPTSAPAALRHAEEAVWATDQLLGREEAAGIEAQQDRLIRRLEDLADALDTASDADLERLLALLHQEMRELAKTMQAKRPQLPTELIQREALRSEEADDRNARMQNLREALANGDREAAKAQLQELIQQLRDMREAMAQGASEWLERQALPAAELEAQVAALRQLQARQQQLAERAVAAESERFRAERRAESAMRGVGRDEQTTRAAAEQARRAAARGDWGAVAEVLDGMAAEQRDAARAALRELEAAAAVGKRLAAEQESLRKELEGVTRRFADAGIGAASLRESVDEADAEMRAAGKALAEGEPQGAAHGFRAADALERAVDAMQQLAAGIQGMRAAPGFRGPIQPGGDRSGSELATEPFAVPEARADRLRADVLKGFRGGLPDTGRDVNERYLDRLLH